MYSHVICQHSHCCMTKVTTFCCLAPLSAGGVGGLINVVLNGIVPGIGMRSAWAEGNALGKGPVVMHVPRCGHMWCA